MLESNLKLVKQEEEILFNYSERKIKKIFEDCTTKANINQISKLFCLLTERKTFFGKGYLGFISEAISREKTDQLRKYLKAAKDLLKIDDQYKKDRTVEITRSFSKALDSLYEKKVNSSFDVVWQWFIKIAAKN